MFRLCAVPVRTLVWLPAEEIICSRERKFKDERAIRTEIKILFLHEQGPRTVPSRLLDSTAENSRVPPRRPDSDVTTQYINHFRRLPCCSLPPVPCQLSPQGVVPISSWMKSLPKALLGAAIAMHAMLAEQGRSRWVPTQPSKYPAI